MLGVEGSAGSSWCTCGRCGEEWSEWTCGCPGAPSAWEQRSDTWSEWFTGSRTGMYKTSHRPPPAAGTTHRSRPFLWSLGTAPDSSETWSSRKPLESIRVDIEVEIYFLCKCRSVRGGAMSSRGPCYGRAPGPPPTEPGLLLDTEVGAHTHQPARRPTASP